MPILRRQTEQRKIILRELRRSREHPDARKVYRMARRRLPSISFATVYRNLGVLRDRGDITELNCGGCGSRYDGHTEEHHHFICESCRSVLDLDKPVLRGLDEGVARRSGCSVRYHRINFYGLCKACKNKSNERKGEKHGKDDKRK